MEARLGEATVSLPEEPGQRNNRFQGLFRWIFLFFLLSVIFIFFGFLGHVEKEMEESKKVQRVKAGCEKQFDFDESVKDVIGIKFRKEFVNILSFVNISFGFMLLV